MDRRKLAWRRGERGPDQGEMDHSESVHLDSGFVHSVLHKERGDLGTLVALQLDYLAHFFVVNDSTIASEFLHNVEKSVNNSRTKGI